MNMFELNPFIRYAKNFQSLPPVNKTSICYDCRLFFISNVSGTIIINDTEYQLTNNIAIFIPAGSRYKLSWDIYSNIDIIIINFDLTTKYSKYTKELCTATVDNFNVEKLCYTQEFAEFKKEVVRGNSEKLQNNLIKCCREFLICDTYYHERASAFLKICLLELIDSDENAAGNPIVKSVMDYIYTNYQNVTLSNQTIADNLGYHPYYISQLMKKNTGKTLHQNIQAYRINIAKNMLITSQLDIDTICWKTGFNYTSHFIDTFKKYVGTTPAKYRKTHQVKYF